MSIATCSHCHAILYTAEIPPGVKSRCGACGQVEFVAGGKDEFVRYRSAWWSMWLGLASIVFLFLTGIPAVYLGVKSILKMQYLKVTDWTRRAAYIGVFSGGIFGVFFGGCVGFVGLVAFATFWTHQEIEDPIEVAKIHEQVASVSLPPDLKPYVAHTGIFIPDVVEFWDNEKFTESRTRFYYGSYSTMITNSPGSGGQNRNVLKGFVTRRILAKKENHLEDESTETLKCLVMGEERDVTKVIHRGEFENKKEGTTMNLDCVTYSCMLDTQKFTYYLKFWCDLPDAEMSDEEVLQIFQSFQGKH
ncbi:MAG: hypothetical protein AAGA30_00010 [Planctomycetota bacterium]